MEYVNRNDFFVPLLLHLRCNGKPDKEPETMVTPAASLMGTPEVSESKPWGIAKIGPGYCLTGYGLGYNGSRLRTNF